MKNTFLFHRIAFLSMALFAALPWNGRNRESAGSAGK
jgi:hypothetical protein